MEQSARILSLLSESAVRTNLAISLQKNQHNHLSQRDKALSDGEKMIYFEKEKIMSENFINGALTIIKTILLLNKVEVKEDLNLYDLWLLLKEEEKTMIASETFKKYREMHEYRKNSRKPNVEVTELVDSLTKEGVENKLKICLRVSEKEDVQIPIVIPDNDFFSKFSIGLIRHLFDSYIYNGKLTNVQKNKACYEIFGALRGIVEADDERFRRMMSRYKIFINEANDAHHM